MEVVRCAVVAKQTSLHTTFVAIIATCCGLCLLHVRQELPVQQLIAPGIDRAAGSCMRVLAWQVYLQDLCTARALHPLCATVVPACALLVRFDRLGWTGPVFTGCLL
jgi:hypothetical protein